MKQHTKRGRVADGPSLTLSVMPEEGKKNNDRKGYPEQPQKRASAESHLNLLLVDE
jgi:hypothetical protein